MSESPFAKSRTTSGIRVQTGARLHFGLIGFGKSAFPFGGAGMMIDHPGTVVEVRAAERFSLSGKESKRTAAFAEYWSEYHDIDLRGIQIHVPSAITPHAGLGSGTQLALALATALCEFCGMPSSDAGDLAGSVRRGKRSSVGAIGFIQGGFIFERGHESKQPIATDYDRLTIPDQWRIVTVNFANGEGFSGEKESQAFSRLDEVPPELTSQLAAIAENRMLPAVAAGDLHEFGAAVYEFGKISGGCFHSVQGGCYANDATARAVDFFLNESVRGVGQSSWGPTVFAIVADESEAERLSNAFSRYEFEPEATIRIARPLNHGRNVTEVAFP